MRFSVGAGTQISEKWGIELHFMQQGEKVPGIAFTNDESILRLRLFYTFN
jgi:hypothetical protein